ncbi:Hypothetical predicted protein [Octopus vulgaris]|nr:Hypothetical predicted protein [Octopus vulgaris]
MVNPGGSLTSQLYCAATCLDSDGQAMFAFSTSLGSILLFCMPTIEKPGEVTRFELCHSSMMQRIWSGLVPNIIKGSSETAEKTLSMVMDAVDDEVFIFCVCKDHKLRWWSTKTQECLMVFNLLDLTRNKQHPHLPSIGAPGHSVRKVSAGDHVFPSLCVHLSFSDCNQFCFIESSFNDGRYQLHHIGSIFGPSEDLTDFCLTGDRLLTLWSSSSGEPIARIALFPSDQTAAKEWTDVILQPPETADLWIPNYRDPRDVYMEKIFYPGCFSTQDIVRALNVYKRSVHVRQDTVSLISLKEEVTNTVETEIRNAAMEYQLDEDEYCQLQLEHWTKFYSCCVQYQEVDSKCLGLFVDEQSGLICCIRKNHLTYFCPCDIVEELYIGDGNTEAAVALLNAVECRAEGHMVTDVLHVFKCMQLIAGDISEDLGSQLEYEASVTLDLEQAAGSLVDSCLALNDLLIDNIKSHLENVIDLVNAVRVISAHLNLSTLQLDSLDLNDSSRLLSQIDWGQLFASNCATSVIIAHMEHFVCTRLNATRDLLLLLLIAMKCGDQAHCGSGQCWSLQINLMPQVILNFRCYLVLKWVMSTVALPSPANTVEFNLTQLAALDISEATAQTPVYTPHIGSGQPSLTLAELFLRGIGGLQVRTTLINSKMLNEEVPTLWINSLIPIIKILAKLLWPDSFSFLFPEFLVGHCQYLHLQEYVRMLSSWCPKNEHSRKFLLGQAYLYFNEPYKAAQSFVEAAEGLNNGEPFLVRKLLQINDDMNIPMMEVNYYLKVINQFEHFQHPHIVISLAEEAICIASESDPNIATLYLKVFKYHLELGHYEKAYNAMVTNPDPSSCKDCLRQLLNVLCDRKQLNILVRFPYNNLQEEVVSILKNRARSVDLSSHNYYDLLFSIHISRNSYRAAGNVMYEQGLRLGQELPGVRGLQRQVQCYLAAMHALRLAKPEYAWVVKPIPNRLTHPAPEEGTSPKHYLDGEEKIETDAPKRQLQIVTIEDLEKEYLLVDARLRLIKKDADLMIASGPAIQPDEMIGILVSVGLFDRAIIICKAYDLPLNPVFENLALRCVTLSLCESDSGDENITENAWQWLKENEISQVLTTKVCSASDQAWLLLKTYLSKYEEPNARYHRCTAIKLLSHNYQLPTWFVNPYKTLDVAELIRLYISFDKLEEAVAVTLEYLDAVLGTLQGQDNHLYRLKGYIINKPFSLWIPLTSIDQIFVTLQEENHNSRYKELHDLLMTSVNTYKRKVMELTQFVNSQCTVQS